MADGQLGCPFDYVSYPSYNHNSITKLHLSFGNYTLKYVDASFYQVARGLVLPFTVGASSFFLHTRPSLLILAACSIVTFGFFIGVFLDGMPLSLIGIGFGVASSAITALHSIVIKKSLDVVKGSALTLSWYTNLLSAMVFVPLVLLAGELPAIFRLWNGAIGASTASKQEQMRTFLWGSLITVSTAYYILSPH